MPPKTRKKATKTADQIKENGSQTSSDESVSSKSIEIIAKLSQKYLNTGHRTRQRKKVIDVKNGYEGDEENTASPSSSSLSASPYDFEDEPMTMSEDSNSGKKTKSSKKSVKTKVPKQPKPSKRSPKAITPPSKPNKSVRFSENDMSSEKVTLTLPKTPLPRTELRTPVVALEQIDVQMIEESQRQLRKRKTIPLENVTPNVKVSKKDPKQKVNLPEHVTPKITVPIKEKVKVEPKLKLVKGNNSTTVLPLTSKIVPEMVQDSSTPNELVRTRSMKKRGNDSCFGFEVVKRDSLLVSPVKKVPITPMSDYASMDTYSHDITMDDSLQKSDVPSPQLFSMEEDDFPELQVNKSLNRSYSKPKKRFLTKKQQVAKSNELVEKINNELKEIESFELSIEQD